MRARVRNNEFVVHFDTRIRIEIVENSEIQTADQV
jgi:hypothetical protein